MHVLSAHLRMLLKNEAKTCSGWRFFICFIICSSAQPAENAGRFPSRMGVFI